MAGVLAAALFVGVLAFLVELEVAVVDVDVVVVVAGVEAVVAVDEVVVAKRVSSLTIFLPFMVYPTGSMILLIFLVLKEGLAFDR